MKKYSRSITRTEAREMEKKINPAIKALSSHVHNTTTDLPVIFEGYSVVAGSFEKNGKEWQLQVRAVCAKRLKIKEKSVVPIFKQGFALTIAKIKGRVKNLVDSVNS